jgi:hypothetical protein
LPLLPCFSVLVYSFSLSEKEKFFAWFWLLFIMHMEIPQYSQELFGSLQQAVFFVMMDVFCQTLFLLLVVIAYPGKD